RYLIAWGAIIYGGGMFLLNLARWSSSRSEIALDESQVEPYVRRQNVVGLTFLYPKACLPGSAPTSLLAGSDTKMKPA
ncbi:MAG: hypothetical protein WAN86_20050, partial [Hyphomicrobiaceae bacterium]